MYMSICRVVIDWRNRTVEYWKPEYPFVITCPRLQYESMYDVMLLAMTAGRITYRDTKAERVVISIDNEKER
jgi:hypothetical protein